MRKPNSLYKKITDDPEMIGFDNHLVVVSCILAIISFIIGTIANFFLPLGKLIIISGFVGLAIFSGLYYLARFRGKYNLTKIIYVFTLSAFIDVLWLFNYGSAGPIIYIYIVVHTGFMFFLNGKQLWIFNVFFIINTGGMFYLEYAYPELLGTYVEEKYRLIDVYTGLIIYLTVATILMIYIKKGFIKERDKAMHSERLKSAFLANMSHEIRTPMNSILGYSQLLRRRTDDPTHRHYLDIIDQNGEYLMDLLEDILDMSRIEAGEVRIFRSNIVVKELFEDIHSLLGSRYSNFIQTKATITGSVEPEDLVIRSDYQRIKQILLNFLTNAMKYTPEGSIRYSCKIENGRVIFCVKDTGKGIDITQKETIFRRFNKIGERERLYPGTGIGLTIARELSELLGGQIWFDSIPDKGSAFYFALPVEVRPEADR